MLEIGRVTKAHGLRGEVVVKLVTNRTERMDAGSVFTVDGRDMCIERSRPHHNDWIVQFAGVSTREAAEALQGAVLEAEPLDDPDELWVHDLIGARVVDVNGAVIGTCVAVQANPASDLLVLDGGALIPLRFVVEHTPECVTVDPPAGLLEL